MFNITIGSYLYHFRAQRKCLNVFGIVFSCLYRLSAVAGTKLKYNNPGITDLSDDNRPNKLAEKFSELYDNEWTAAFEVIESTKEMDKNDAKEQNKNEEWNIVTEDAKINDTSGAEISEADTKDDTARRNYNKDTKVDTEEGISQDELEKQVVGRLVDVLQV